VKRWALARRAVFGRVSAALVGLTLIAGLDPSGYAAHVELAGAATVLAVASTAPTPWPLRALLPPPLPPHLVPGLLDPIGVHASPLGANLSLAETLTSLGPWRARLGTGDGADAAPPVGSPPSDPEAIREATRHYVRARAAMQSNQLLLAATHFESALALDASSPEILSGYASLLTRLGNGPKSRDFFTRALAIDPTHLEARVALGFHARQRANFDDTIRLLGPLLEDPTERDALTRSYAPPIRLAVTMAVADALAATGADAALIEISHDLLSKASRESEPALLAPLNRMRRMIGDAQARSGALRDAWQLWSTALTQAMADDDEGRDGDPSILPLAARVLWAERTLLDRSDGERAGVRHPVETLADLIAHSERTGQPPLGGMDAWISLADWLASTATDGAPLDAALRARASSLPVRRGEPDPARLAAALAPAQAFERLAASHDRSRPDRAHLAAWLRAAAAIAPARAVTLAANLLADTPLAPEFVVDGLLHAGLTAPTLLETLEAGDARDEKRVALRMRVLARFQRTAEAWALGEASLTERNLAETNSAETNSAETNLAQATDADERALLLRARLAVAVAAQRFSQGEGGMPALIAELRADSEAAAADARATQRALANEIEVLRSLLEAARLDAADASEDRTGGGAPIVAMPDLIEASIERTLAIGAQEPRARTLALLARASIAAMAPMTDRGRAERVLELFREAIDAGAADPSAVEAELEQAWIAALSLTRSLASRAAGGEPSDAERAAEDAILKQIPGTAIAIGVRAARHTRGGSGRAGEGERRREPAVDLIELVCAAAAARPADGGLLREAVRGLTTARGPSAALALLDQRLERAPAAADIWELWTETAIEAGLAEEALARLSRHIGEGADDPIGETLVARPLRALGREAEAAAAEERAIERRLPTPRTRLHAIRQSLARGAAGEAVERLWSFADELTEAGRAPNGDEVFDPGRFAARERALELALRLPGDADPSGTTDGTDRARLIRRLTADMLADAEDPSAVERIGAAAFVRAAGILALVQDDLPEDSQEDLQAEARSNAPAAAERARLASIAVAMQARAGGELDAQAIMPWLGIAQAFADEGRFASGSDFLRSLATSDLRMSASAAARLATACFALDAAAGGRADRSIALLDLTRARGVRPFAGRDRVVDRDVDELYLLASLYAMVLDHAGARTILEESLRRDPQHAMSMNNLGWELLESSTLLPKDIDIIVALLEGAHAARPDDGAILDSLGWLRYKQGRIDEAFALLTRAIEVTEGETSLEILDHFGDAAWRRGDRDAARNAWNEVVRRAETDYAEPVIVSRLPDYERREHGVRVIDAPRLWQRVYGAPRDRARAKLAALDAGADPPVASIW
jgi:tetratricopeptide (TPR) repeat protein